MHSVCQPELPDASEVWGRVIEQSGEWFGYVDLQHHREYQCYFNQHRCHTSRNGARPVEISPRDVIDIKGYRWNKHCRGFFDLPVAA
jgi:hypothetical protein